jgi:hypothetical protein
MVCVLLPCTLSTAEIHDILFNVLLYVTVPVRRLCSALTLLLHSRKISQKPFILIADVSSILFPKSGTTSGCFEWPALAPTLDHYLAEIKHAMVPLVTTNLSEGPEIIGAFPLHLRLSPQGRHDLNMHRPAQSVIVLLAYTPFT